MLINPNCEFKDFDWQKNLNHKPYCLLTPPHELNTPSSKSSKSFNNSQINLQSTLLQTNDFELKYVQRNLSVIPLENYLNVNIYTDHPKNMNLEKIKQIFEKVSQWSLIIPSSKIINK